jgi:hypothetical protein
MKPPYRCPRCSQEFSRKWNMLFHCRTQHGFDPSPAFSTTKPTQLYRGAYLLRALRRDRAYTRELLTKFLKSMTPAIMEGIKCDVATSVRVANSIDTLVNDEELIMARVLREAQPHIGHWLEQIDKQGLT